MKSDSKVDRRNNTTPLFARCSPRRRDPLLRCPIFLRENVGKTMFWTVASTLKTFLIAEENHVQIQSSRCKRQPRAITDVTSLQKGRYETIWSDFTRFALKSVGLPPRRGTRPRALTLTSHETSIVGSVFECSASSKQFNTTKTGEGDGESTEHIH